MCSHLSKFFLTLMLSLSLGLAGITGCGDDDDDGGNLSGTEAQQLATALASANQAVFLADGSGTVCSNGGTADITDNGDTTQVVFTNCDGINGSITFVINTEVFSIDGELSINNASSSCDVAYDNYSFQFSQGNPNDPNSASATINGTISANCGGGDFICSFDNVDINDAAALQNACD